MTTVREPLAQFEQREASQERELDERFAADRIGALCDEFLEHGLGINLKERINGRQFVVAYIPAESPYSDIGRSVETTVFANAFKQTKAQIVRDYGKYDAASTFACVIDVSGDISKAAGALRIIEHDPILGFKDMNDLVEDSPNNPWIDEIKYRYFAPGETYDPTEAWKRLGVVACADRNPEDSLDIATHASADDYRGKRGDINGVSMLFYHACLRFALAERKVNLLAIFDLKPLENLQQFGEPFDTYEGLEPHPYGGPYDTIPAYCVLEKGIERIRQKNALVGGVFIDGVSLNELALLPNEYFPEKYSNQAVGIQD